MQKVKVGVVGCGMISKRYVEHMQTYKVLEVAACADLEMPLAEAMVKQVGDGCRACRLDEMLGDESIELVVNLTTPAAHAKIALSAMEAGKHVYNEKPLGATRGEAQEIMAAAKKKGARVGCAPDTVLGAGHQTARKLVDDGAIGKITAATAFCQGGGPEGYHPNPFFLFGKGGGPMLDMGPYYLSALVQMLGPIDRVVGLSSQSRPERTVRTKGSPNLGKPIAVTIQDHVAGTVQFKSGAIATLILSWANPVSPLPRIMLFGLEGSMEVPDPNGFDGQVKICRPGGQWEEQALGYPTGLLRGAGIAEMADAIRCDRPHRASGDLALHVLDALEGLAESSEDGQAKTVTARYERTAPMPTELELSRLEG